MFFLLENIRVAGARAHFMRLYILFSSFQFNSFQFYSIQRDENNETLRMITKITKKNEKNENNENYEILRNITKKRKNVVKKITLAWYFMLKLYTFLYMLRMYLLHFFFFSFVFLFFRSFSFFSLISFLFVICELRFFY